MSKESIHYRIMHPDEHTRYKYELVGDHSVTLHGQFPDCRLSLEVGMPWVHIRAGVLYFQRGYQWDGPSGPTIDTADWMRASLAHDALYQLIIDGGLRPIRRMHIRADAEMKLILGEEGMPAWRRAYSWLAVRTFGGLVVRYRVWRRRRAA